MIRRTSLFPQQRPQYCVPILRAVICQITNDTRRREDYRVLTPSAQRTDRVGIAKAIELGTAVSATGSLPLIALM